MRLQEKVEDAKKHGLIHLNESNLSACPIEIFSPDLTSCLVRLDLSFNGLVTLPETIGSLSALQFLWVNHNPLLRNLPSSLSKCSRLVVLDVSYTSLKKLPCELGRINKMRVLNMESTPMETKWLLKKYITQQLSNEESCDIIQKRLRWKDERTQLKRLLYERLEDEVYKITFNSTPTDTNQKVQLLIKRVLKYFDNAEEIRSLIRNALRLFPSDMDKADPIKIRKSFEILRSENEMKKMSAELELKIRALYFDRIDPTCVEGMVKSIYKEIHQLKDIKFLIKHVPALFPPESKDVNGKNIHQKLVALQEEMARERAAAVDKLFAAVKGIYSDTEPDRIRELVMHVAAIFKNIKDLKSVAADASILFPSEFLNANPAEIKATFIRIKQDTLGVTATTGNTNGMTNRRGDLQ